MLRCQLQDDGHDNARPDADADADSNSDTIADAFRVTDTDAFRVTDTNTLRIPDTVADRVTNADSFAEPGNFDRAIHFEHIHGERGLHAGVSADRAHRE